MSESGDISGTYYATANAICDLINRDPDLRRLRCSPEPTQGSIYNLAMIAIGETEFAFAQSDWQRAAYLGSSVFAGTRPQEDLRSVMSLYPETVTMLAASDSGISVATDSFGKRVDIGLPSSGRHATVLEMLNRIGMGGNSFGEMVELSPTNALTELCAGRIDAMVLVVGHPNPLVAEATGRCGARLVRLDGAQLSAALEEAEDFQPSTIPARTYAGQDSAVNSWAVYATIVTRARTADIQVEAMVRAVLDNRERLGRRVPVLSGLDPAEMQRRALTAPLHPAAVRVFAGAGGQ